MKTFAELDYNRVIVNTKKVVVMVLLLFVLLFAATLMLCGYLLNTEVADGSATFSDKVDDLQHDIYARMEVHENILMGVKGLFDASQEVSRAEFNNYLQHLRLTQHYPGIQIIAYAEWFPANELADREHRIRAEGYPAFAINTLGKADFYSMIVYMEPFDDLNKVAFGYDAFSEPNRREAMSFAAANHQLALTNKVTLLQEINKNDIQAGTILYLPIYKKHLPIATPQERWAALQGFVSAGFRMGDFLQVLSVEHQRDIHFSVYASGDEHAHNPADTSALLYQSPSEQASSYSRFTQVRHLTFYGKQWTLVARSSDFFEQDHQTHVYLLVFLFGTAINLLLCLFIYFILNQRAGAIHLARRMTEDLHHNNAALKLSEERLQLALDSVQMGVWMWNIATNELMWDATMCELFDKHPKQSPVTYDDFILRVHEKERDRITQALQDAVAGVKDYDVEYPVVWRDNSVHTITARAKVTYNDQHQPQWMIGTCLDISERKRLDKLKTEFVSTVSHELRTPLTTINAVLGMAIGGALGELSEKAKPVFDIAYKNSLRLRLLINDLLDMDKLLAGKLPFNCSPQPLIPLVERAIQENKTYIDQFHITCVLVPCEQHLVVNVEEARFLQVMTNFLSNAAKFSPAESEINIVIDVRNDYVRISVIDQGIGVSEDAKKHIFEKFYQADSSDTRSKGGTGLGLAITKELVEGMKGRVGFTSEQGKGSCFFAEFPLVESTLKN